MGREMCRTQRGGVYRKTSMRQKDTPMEARERTRRAGLVIPHSGRQYQTLLNSTRSSMSCQYRQAWLRTVLYGRGGTSARLGP
eukprot:3621686-Rhodomonas_salina.2